VTSVERAIVIVGDVRFVLDDDCGNDADTRITMPGPTLVTLTDGPSPYQVALQDGAYCRIRLPLVRAGVGMGTFGDDAGGATPSLLEGHSVLVTGRRSDGAPFTVRSRSRSELSVRSRDEPFVLGEAGRALILAFDAGIWWDGVDLDGAVPDASGAVTIDDATDRASVSAFEANLSRSLGLFRDGDEDGTLDTAELEDELAAAP
jgi:hypothetical protein